MVLPSKRAATALNIERLTAFAPALIERLRKRTSYRETLDCDTPRHAPDYDCHHVADMIEALIEEVANLDR